MKQNNLLSSRQLMVPSTEVLTIKMSTNFKYLNLWDRNWYKKISVFFHSIRESKVMFSKKTIIAIKIETTACDNSPNEKQ